MVGTFYRAGAPGAKALVEVSAEFIKTATSKEFINSLEVAVGQDPSPDSPIPDVANIIDKIVQIADKVPEPEDLKVIGAALYKLLAIEQAPLDEAKLGATTDSHIVLERTGKLRLLQFGFDQSFRLQNFGKGASVSSLDVNRLGARRLWRVGKPGQPAVELGTRYIGPAAALPAAEVHLAQPGIGFQHQIGPQPLQSQREALTTL